MSAPALHVSHRISGVEDRWRSLSTDLYSTPEWLRSYESTGTERRYVVADGQDGPTAAMLVEFLDARHGLFQNPAALLHQDIDDLQPHLSQDERSALGSARSRLRELGMSLHPSAVVVLPGGFRPGILRRDESDGEPAQLMLETLEELSHERGCGTTAFAHVPESDVVLAKTLAERNYLSFACLAECVLHTPWNDMDGYFAAMTQRRRSRARREIRDFEASGAVLREAELEQLGEGHARLLVAHSAKFRQDVSLEQAHTILLGIRQCIGPYARLIEVHVEGQLAAFLVYFVTDSFIYPKLLGMSKTAARAPYTYFNLAYYAMVERAVASGAKGLIMGPEAYNAKALRGCAHEIRTMHLKVPEQAHQVTARITAILDRAYRRRIQSNPWLPFGESPVA